jgi:UDP-glucose 4-epimerase
MMQAFITGGAGFIGSNLADRLLAEGHTVTVYDNFSTGRAFFLDNAQAQAKSALIHGDTLDLDRLKGTIAGHDIVFHLAANADVRRGPEHPGKDLQQNTIATFHVLEAMRAAGVRRIAFASTGSVYGEPEVFPTPENCPFPVQTSLYGASKLAGESLIAAYCQAFGFQAFIFRFVSILGERYTHGHVFDFYHKLLMNPHRIEVLGNGRQRKSYLYVHDCIDAMLVAIERAAETINIINLGAEEYCTVDDSLGWICAHLALNPHRSYSGGERGWVGDNPFIFLDTRKIRSLGWRPKLTIRQGVLRTLEYLQGSPELVQQRRCA